MRAQQETALSIIIYDLEFTAWDGSLKRKWSGKNEHREIVEIGAVRINLDTGAASEKHFSTLVKPTINHQISSYFTDLTGITQTHLDNHGVHLETALNAFFKFSDGASHFYAYGEDNDVIRENCELTGLENPFVGKQMIDARSHIQAAYSLDHAITSADLPSVLGNAAAELGLKAHSALDDARAVASALVPLLLRGGKDIG